MKINNEWKDYRYTQPATAKSWSGGKHCVVASRPAGYPHAAKPLHTVVKPHARYIRSSSGGGHWEYDAKIPESWNVSWRNLTFCVRPMNFKHTGLFPEQAANWATMIDLISKARRPIKVLNLFAYTGGATVACLSAGASVCHVDAAKTWWKLLNKTLRFRDFPTDPCDT